MGVRIAGSCLHPYNPSSVSIGRLADMKHHGVLQDTVTCEAASFKGAQIRRDCWSTLDRMFEHRQSLGSDMQSAKAAVRIVGKQ